MESTYNLRVDTQLTNIMRPTPLMKAFQNHPTDKSYMSLTLNLGGQFGERRNTTECGKPEEIAAQTTMRGQWFLEFPNKTTPRTRTRQQRPPQEP